MPFPTFDTADAVPEVIRSSYVERDGKWVPDDSDLAGLKTSQRTLLAEKKAQADELAKYRATLGDRKLDDVAELIKAHASTEEDRARKAGEFDKLLAKREKEIRDEYEPKVKQGQEYRTKYEDKELTDAIREAAGKAKVIPEDMKAIIKLVKGDRVRLDEKTGKAVVYDEDGDPSAHTLEKFFTDTFRTEYPKFYQPAGGSGGGANGGSSGSGNRSASNGTIDMTDNAAFLANIDKIAKGEVKATSAS